MNNVPNNDIIDFNELGNAKFIQEDYHGAIADYTKAITIHPDQAEPLYNRGNAKYNLEDYQGAIAISTKASLKYMIAPGALVIISPLLAGLLFGPAAVEGSSSGI